MNRILRDLLILFGLVVLLVLATVGLGSALIPLLASFGAAYLFFPLIQKLETKGIDRRILVTGIFTFFVVTTLLLLALVVPVLVNESISFIQELPTSTLKAVDKVNAMMSYFGYTTHFDLDWIMSVFQAHQGEISSSLLKGLTNGLNLAFSSMTTWLLAILNVFLIPLFFFYVVIDFEKISQDIQSLVPRSILPKMKYYLKVSDQVLSGYIRGQILVALILSAIYSIGLAIVDIRFGLVIGIVAGLLSIIPYVGFTTGFASALVMALANFESIGTVLGVVVVFSIGQILESFVITPKLVGNKVGLGPLATILSLIIGGNLLGFIGMLVAIPVAGIAKHIFIDLKKEYQSSDLYQL